MKRENRGHAVQNLFVFLLLGLFAAFGTLLVLLGAQAWHGLGERTVEHADARILRSFMRHAVRAEDEAGCVTVRDLNGTAAICIADEAAQDSYVTCIYVYDGALRELYADPADGLAPERGEVIAPAKRLEASVDGQRLHVALEGTDGQMIEMTIALYAEEVTP